MKRIVFFCGTMSNGGAERVISILSNYLVKKDYSVEILQYYEAECNYVLEESIKKTCVVSETGSTHFFRNSLFIRKHIKENADVLISFMTVYNIVALFCSLGLQNKTIVSERNDPFLLPLSIVRKVLRRILYRHADYFVFQTEKAKSFFSKSIQSRSVVIYNPVDIGKQKGLAFSVSHKKQIVNVGRLMPQKNQKLLIDAFRRVLNKHPDYELVIYGEGEYRKELEKHCDLLAVSEKVLLAGNVTDVLERISAGEVFVLSSDYEGMPNALMEAMCLGLPVISTRVAGATDLIKNGVNGLLVDTNNPNQLSEAIDLLLSDTEFRKKLSTEAVKVADKLNVELIAQKWIDLIETI